MAIFETNMSQMRLRTTKAIYQTYLGTQLNYFNNPNYAKFERSQNRLLDLKF